MAARKASPGDAHGLSPDMVNGILERLLAPACWEDFEDLPCKHPYDLLEELRWGKGMRHKDEEGLYPDVARKLAYQRRLRLALAVSMLCRQSPGAARFARWHDIDREGRIWKVQIARVLPGRKSRRERAPPSIIDVRLPDRAVGAFNEAFGIRNGLNLLLSIVQPVEGPVAESRRRLRWPRRPPPPRPSDLVFPGKAGDPIPEHAFRELCKRWDIPATPVDLCIH